MYKLDLTMYQLPLLILSVVMTWNLIPPADSEEQVEITTPDNSVFYRKIGNLYPSVNVGHIRLQKTSARLKGSQRQYARTQIT